MKNIRNILLIIGCIMLVSCRKYLDIKPKGTLIPTTYSEFSKILDYEYNFTLSDDISDIYSDDVYLYGFVYSSWLSAPMQRAYKWESPVFYSGDFDNDWSSSYSRIFNFNLIIKEIDGAEHGTEKQKKNLKAEAYLSRAFEYLRLLQKYGKPYDVNTSNTDLAVPLRLEPVVSPEVLTRASVQSVLDQVKSDLEKASNSELPDVADKKHRGSKAGVYGIYAKMYLYMRDYKKVYEYADSALQLVGTPLPIEDYNNYQIVDPFGGRGRTNLPDAYNSTETVYLKLSEQLPSGYVFISNSLKSLYLPGDKRFEFYFANPYYGALYETEMFARHLMMNLGVGTPELLLLRAEAAARQNNLNRAIIDLNTLRAKRVTPEAYGSGFHSDNQKEVIRMILNERRRELCFLNGTRFYDMKRLCKDPDFQITVITRIIDGETFSLEPGSSKYAFPIWLKVIESNPGMQQN